MHHFDVFSVGPDIEFDDAAAATERVHDRRRAAVAGQLVAREVRVVRRVPVVVGQRLAHVVRHLDQNKRRDPRDPQLTNLIDCLFINTCIRSYLWDPPNAILSWTGDRAPQVILNLRWLIWNVLRTCVGKQK